MPTIPLSLTGHDRTGHPAGVRTYEAVTGGDPSGVGLLFISSTADHTL